MGIGNQPDYGLVGMGFVTLTGYDFLISPSFP